MKKGITCIIITLSVCLVILLGYTVYYGELSEAALLGKKNIQNLEKVQTGMDSLTVLKIMGKPCERYVFKEDISNYKAKPEGDASDEELIELIKHTDKVAEIQNTLRYGAKVSLLQ